MSKKLLIIAGDPSGDKHGADLIEALYDGAKRLKIDRNKLELYALGGPKIESTGINFLFNLVNLSIIGFSEAVKKYFVFRNVFKKIVEPFLKEKRPDGVILIDSYAFNIHVAELAKQLNIPVIYYVSPQVWASRPGRIKKLVRYVDKMLVIFPFEEEIYRKTGLDVTFIGHPFLDTAQSVKGQKKVIDQLGLVPEHPIIGILPGSRIQEIEQLLPVMLQTAKKITKQFPDAQFILPLSMNISPDYVRTYINKFIVAEEDSSMVPKLKIIRDHDYHARSIMTMALVASGSATLENACLGIPMIILYRVSSISYLLAKMLVKVRWIGMANIIAGRKIVPEFIQYSATADNVGKKAIEWMLNPDKLKQIREELAKVKEKLGTAGASQRAADIILGIILKRK